MKSTPRSLFPLVGAVCLLALAPWGAAQACQDNSASPHSALTALCPYQDGLASFQINGEWGLLDKAGVVRVPPRYKSIGAFAEGLALVQSHDDKEGYIDKTGRVVIPLAFESAQSFSEGLAAVYQGGLWGYIDKTGRWVVAPAYASAQPFRHGVALVALTYQGSAQLISRLGQVIKTIEGPADIGSAGFNAHGLARIELRGTALLRHIDGRTRPVADDANSAPPAIDTKREEASGLLIVPPREGIAPELSEVRSPEGRTLATVPSCAAQSHLGTPLALVFFGCGSTVLVTPGGQVTTVAERSQPIVTHTATHLLLRFEQAESAGDAQEEQPKPFYLLDAQARVQLSHADARLPKGRFGHIELLQGQGKLAQTHPELLPLAVWTNFSDVAIVSPAGQLVVNPDWRYERNDSSTEGPLPLKTDAGMGAVNAQGAWVVEPRFTSLTEFKNGVAFAKKLGRTVLVDYRGRLHALPENAYRFERVAPLLLEGRTDNDERVRVDLQTGRTDRQPRQGVLPSWGDLKHGLAPAQKDNHWGLINDAGAWVVPAQYRAEPKPQGQGDRFVGWLVSTEGSLQLPKSPYERKPERYGVLGLNGQVLMAPQFKRIQWDDDTQRYTVEADGGTGVFSATGQELIPPVYASVRAESERGWYRVETPVRKGLINAKGDWVLPPGALNLYGWDNRTRLSTEIIQGQEALVDDQGRISTQQHPLAAKEDGPHYWWSRQEDAQQYENNETVFYGFDWAERLRLRGEPVTEFSEGLAVFQQRTDSGSRHVLVDTRGRVVVSFNDERVAPFSQGLAAVEVPAPSRPAPPRKGKTKQPYMAEEEASRWGYIDRQARRVIAPRFERAQPFSEDRAAVMLNGNWAVIDRNGHVIVQGAWLCGRQPILVNAQQRIVWPLGLAAPQRCQ